MRRKWLIGTMLLIVVLETWAMSLATAQYTCSPDKRCSTTNNQTQCWNSCSGVGWTNCTKLVNKIYTGQPTQDLETPGPCKDATPTWIDCYTKYTCSLVTNSSMRCQWDYNDFYCEYPGAMPSDSCSSCNPPQAGTIQQVQTYTCSNCGG